MTKATDESSWTEVLSKIGNIMLAFQERAGEIAVAFRESIYDISMTVAAIAEALPDTTRHHIVQLAAHGWYVDEEMPLGVIATLSKAFEEENPGADTLAVEYQRSRVGGVEATLTARWPHRTRIFQQAFRAHRDGNYFVSVPTLLAQAEGLAVEFFGEQLYSIGTRRSKQISDVAATMIKDTSGDHLEHSVLGKLLLAYIEPAIKRTPLKYTEKEREKSLTNHAYLNRHVVLHGESTDYGIEINSLRAISHLSYVDWIIDVFKRECLSGPPYHIDNQPV